MKRQLQILVLFFCSYSAFAQTDTLETEIVPYSYADMFYLYNFDNPAANTMPSYLYNYNRHNEFGVNHAILGIKIKNPSYRGAFGFHAGTYVAANYAGEAQSMVRNIYEATIGYQIKDKLWMDAGIFGSYIGLESPIAFDMWTLTRSVMAENAPYYQSGVKLSYEPNQKWFFSGLILNGWQNINETNTNKPLGVQIQYKPNAKILLNASIFWGKEKAAIDTMSQASGRRSFVDLYGTFQFTRRFSGALSIDMGKQHITDFNVNASWYALLGMLRFKPASQMAICIRGEYFEDRYGVMVLTGAQNNFNTSNLSLNLDYLLKNHVLVRLEGKTILSKDAMLIKDVTDIRVQTHMLTTSLSMKF